MKAVVLEIKDGVAAVLCEDGTVTRVRRKCASRPLQVVTMLNRGAAVMSPPALARRCTVRV